MGNPATISFAKDAPSWVPMAYRKKLGVCRWESKKGWRIWVWGGAGRRIQEISLCHELSHCIEDTRKWQKEGVEDHEIWHDSVGCVMITAHEIMEER